MNVAITIVHSRVLSYFILCFLDLAEINAITHRPDTLIVPRVEVCLFDTLTFVV